MKFIKVTQHKGATTLHINPHHIMLISPSSAGAMIHYTTGQEAKIDQSVEEVLALLAQ